MTIQNEQTIIDSNLEKDYEYGFVTDIESEGLSPRRKKSRNGS